MICPPLEELLDQADTNRFTLVNIAAKRAVQIIDAGHANEDRSSKAVTIALEEIYDGKITFVKTKNGIK